MHLHRLSRLCPQRLKAALLGTLLVGSAAASAGTAVQVRATVLERTQVTVQSAPETLDITAEDLARGWLEVPVPMRVAVSSNRSEGARLMLVPVGAAVAGAQIDGLGSGPVLLQRQAGIVVLARPAFWREPAQLELRLRVVLAGDAQPGRHPWPLRVEVAQP